jgi:hypothetical protein
MEGVAAAVSLPRSGEVAAAVGEHARELIRSNGTSKLAIEFGGFLSSHLACTCIALDGLGAPPSLLDSFVASYSKRLHAPPPAVDWQQQAARRQSAPESGDDAAPTAAVAAAAAAGAGEKRLPPLTPPPPLGAPQLPPVGSRIGFEALRAYYNSELARLGGDAVTLVRSHLPRLVDGIVSQCTGLACQPPRPELSALATTACACGVLYLVSSRRQNDLDSSRLVLVRLRRRSTR